MIFERIPTYSLLHTPYSIYSRMAVNPCPLLSVSYPEIHGQHLLTFADSVEHTSYARRKKVLCVATHIHMYMCIPTHVFMHTHTHAET